MRQIYMVITAVFFVAASCESWKEGGGLQSAEFPEIEVNPAEVVFPPIPAGSSTTAKVSVRNVGDRDLLIYSVEIQDSNGPFSLSRKVDDTIPPNSEDIIEITYIAQTGLPEPTVLVIESNASERPKVEVPISVSAAYVGVTVFPNPVDFGDVLGGETAIRTVTVTNSGSSEISISNIYIQPDSSPDFSLGTLPQLPVPLMPWENSTFDVLYTPSGSGGDKGTMTIAYTKEGQQNLVQVELKGRGVGPEISISPPVLDFGYVGLEEKAELDLQVYNMGQYELKIKKVYVAPFSNEDIAVENPPTSVVSVPKGDKTSFTISFSPKTYFKETGEPIGGIVVESNDPNEAIVNIPVYGAVDCPFIKVEPADTVDFGIVAQNWTIERIVQIQNVGHAPLTVFSFEIIENSSLEEFSIEPNQNFPPANGGGAAVIGPSEKVDVKLLFTNNGPPGGEETGKVKIVSDDPLTPEIVLDLVAKRGGSPSCKVTFVPGKLEFGTVAHGANKKMTMYLKNTGSGYCSWKSAIIRDCAAFMGLMVTCSETSPTSQWFKLVASPIPMQDGISPGTGEPLEILYTPPSTIPWIPVFEDYFGVIQVTYTEPYSNPGVYTEHVYPESTNGNLMWNLHGTSGVADIAVLPPELDFGLVTIGCYSQTLMVKVYNAGTAPLQLKDMYLDGCAPEFQIKQFPQLPVEVQPSDYKQVSVVYLPQNQGEDECYLIIESSDLDTPIVQVPLKGQGTHETENVDFFEQISGKKVDILFVIDESGSMCGEQNNLATNFQYLTQVAEQWENDYQIGVTTTNIKNEDKVGKLKGDPRILTKENIDKFPDVVKDVGCSGAGEQESGLEAGRRALSAPLINNTDIPCNCSQDEPCPGVCQEPDTCVFGKCGGYNRGFLRSDAALEVVFVSDEEDQSPGSVPFYIDFYKSIKGFMNEDLFHAHAIVGPKPNGCSGGGSDLEGADAGKRYIELQEATGGVFGSICDPSFAQVLEDIGNKAFGLQVQFFLSAHADPNNIKVWVDSGNGWQQCVQGWNYDPLSNSIYFDEDGPCMPQAGNQIKVWYKMICLTQ